MSKNETKVGYGTSGAPWSAYGEKHMRWIESPRAAGLRFVGYADKIARLNHTGWFTDDDGITGETMRGVVFRMATRDGKPQFIAGYQDPNNGSADDDGPCALSFEITDEELTAAIWADRIAERAAESEREYRAASSAKIKCDDLQESIGATRRETIAMIREMKGARAQAGSVPTICKRLRGLIDSNLESIREAREEISELVSQWGRHDGFKNA